MIEMRWVNTDEHDTYSIMVCNKLEYLPICMKLQFREIEVDKHITKSGLADAVVYTEWKDIGVTNVS